MAIGSGVFFNPTYVLYICIHFVYSVSFSSLFNINFGFCDEREKTKNTYTKLQLIFLLAFAHSRSVFNILAGLFFFAGLT